MEILNKINNMKNLKEFVYNFKTKCVHGFTREEIDILMLNFPEYTSENLFDKIGIVTAMYINDETIIYHNDIYYALKSLIENVELNLYEFD
jgi:hypothetical protein